MAFIRAFMNCCCCSSDHTDGSGAWRVELESAENGEELREARPGVIRGGEMAVSSPTKFSSDDGCGRDAVG